MVRSMYCALAVLCLLLASSDLAIAQMGMGMAIPPGDCAQPGRQPRQPSGNLQAPSPADVARLRDVAGPPYIMEVHVHSTYSDGSNTIAELAQRARDNNIQILVVTDHFEDIQLNKLDFVRFGCNPLNGLFADEAGMLRAINKTSGIENYLSECLNASDEQLLVIPGIEVGIGTPRDRIRDAHGRWDNLVHMLGVGFTSPALVEELNSILGLEGLKKFSRDDKHIALEGAQASVARTLHEYGLATVIAHPYLPDPFHPGHHYTVYKNQLRDVDAIEFFNTTLVGGNTLNTDPTDNSAMEAMGFINRDADQGTFKPLAVTAGCDYHGHNVLGRDVMNEESKWSRQTEICLKRNPFDYMRRGNRDYQAACRVVADALRDPNAVVLAYSGVGQPTTNYINAYLGGDLAATVNLNGTADTFINRAPAAGDVMYYHMPGAAIARVPISVMIEAVGNALGMINAM